MNLLAIAFGTIVPFFIPLAGTLVESIYILDLMNAQMDEKALGAGNRDEININ